MHLHVHACTPPHPTTQPSTGTHTWLARWACITQVLMVAPAGPCWYQPDRSNSSRVVPHSGEEHITAGLVCMIEQGGALMLVQVCAACIPKQNTHATLHPADGMYIMARIALVVGIFLLVRWSESVVSDVVGGIMAAVFAVIETAVVPRAKRMWEGFVPWLLDSLGAVGGRVHTTLGLSGR